MPRNGEIKVELLVDHRTKGKMRKVLTEPKYVEFYFDGCGLTPAEEIVYKIPSTGKSGYILGWHGTYTNGRTVTGTNLPIEVPAGYDAVIEGIRVNLINKDDD